MEIILKQSFIIALDGLLDNKAITRKRLQEKAEIGTVPCQITCSDNFFIEKENLLMKKGRLQGERIG